MINKIFSKLGYIHKSQQTTQPVQNYNHSDFSEFEKETILTVRPYTMTSIERIISLTRAVEYVIKNKIEGDFVECGVWRGGSAMIMTKMLIDHNLKNKKIYLYDTFDGMSAPTELDISFQGEKAEELMKSREKNETDVIWAYASLEDVKRNIFSTGIDPECVNFVKGKVEETIPQIIPDKISILRLDTDWYESTYHELIHLFPRLVQGGIIIIDDYGHWEGAKKAVNQYFIENNIKIFLNRIDYTGRLGIKI